MKKGLLNILKYGTLLVSGVLISTSAIAAPAAPPNKGTALIYATILEGGPGESIGGLKDVWVSDGTGKRVLSCSKKQTNAPVVNSKNKVVDTHKEVRYECAGEILGTAQTSTYNLNVKTAKNTSTYKLNKLSVNYAQNAMVGHFSGAYSYQGGKVVKENSIAKVIR